MIDIVIKTLYVMNYYGSVYCKYAFFRQQLHRQQSLLVVRTRTSYVHTGLVLENVTFILVSVLHKNKIQILSNKIVKNEKGDVDFSEPRCLKKDEEDIRL